MFDTNVVQVKAGHVGQIKRGEKIVWESEPFPVEMGEQEDKLRRATFSVDLGYDKAFKAAVAKIDEVVERLFA